MAICLARPSASHLSSLKADSEADALTYSPVHLLSLPEPPVGYRSEQWSVDLGVGQNLFQNASVALSTWKIHEKSGLAVVVAGPATVGLVVAMAAPLPLFGWIEAVCRVVDVVEDDNRYGFTYGTLSTHPECGEESFSVVRARDGQVSFNIHSVSRPAHWAARALPLVAKGLQSTANRRYLAAMRALA